MVDEVVQRIPVQSLVVVSEHRHVHLVQFSTLGSDQVFDHLYQLLVRQVSHRELLVALWSVCSEGLGHSTMDDLQGRWVNDVAAEVASELME